jgi:hypothetical protein
MVCIQLRFSTSFREKSGCFDLFEGISMQLHTLSALFLPYVGSIFILFPWLLFPESVFLPLFIGASSPISRGL